jgi:hypothetical protein
MGKGPITSTIIVVEMLPAGDLLNVGKKACNK